ncbi:IS605 OrfB family transposase [Rhodococcus sp. SMB37]|nr:IS605 OrfB family transposase [Rhodococcus sp. SMB37]
MRVTTARTSPEPRQEHTAFQSFFTGTAKYPRFKNRHSRQSAHYTRSAFRIKTDGLWLAKTTAPLKVAWSWPGIDLATLDPTMVVVSREADGRWFVTFAVDTSDPAPLPDTGESVGVDLGIKDFAVLSTGEKIANPKHMARHERGLRRHQRRLARMQKGSNNRAKQRRRVTRKHSRVRDARRDFLHKTSTDLVARFDTIAVEDLAPRNMVRNRSLAKSISECGWGEFRSMLEYKAEQAGRRFVVIDRWFPELADVQRVRVSARCAIPRDTPLVVSRLRYPARSGRQCREEHPRRRRAGGDTKRLWRRCQTARVFPSALAGETGTLGCESENPRLSGRGVVKAGSVTGGGETSRR